MLIFDLDGTLVHSNHIWVNVQKEFLQKRQLAYTPPRLRRTKKSIDNILSGCAAGAACGGPIKRLHRFMKN